jgi:hypothetical protein
LTGRSWEKGRIIRDGSGALTAMPKRLPATELKPLIESGVFAELRYVWLFQCSLRTALHAATLDKLGSNLPRHACTGGIWSCVGQLIVGPKHDRCIAVDIAALKAGIEQDGFYLWSAETEAPAVSLTLMR